MRTVALTKRQRECVVRIARSVTRIGIALELGLSAKTVDYHLLKAAEKLGCVASDYAAMTRYAIKKGLLRLGLVAAAVVMLGGCAGAVTENHGGTQVRNPMPSLPPMPPVPMRSFAGAVGVMSRALTANGFTVQLEWNVYGETAGIITGVRGSTNMVNWYELTNLPAASTVDVILEGRPLQMEFYRAFNRWAPK